MSLLSISYPFPLLCTAMNATPFFTTTLFLHVEFIVCRGSRPKSGSVTIVLGNVPRIWICLIVSLTLFFDIQYAIIYYYLSFFPPMFVYLKFSPLSSCSVFFWHVPITLSVLSCFLVQDVPGVSHAVSLQIWNHPVLQRDLVLFSGSGTEKLTSQRLPLATASWPFLRARKENLLKS